MGLICIEELIKQWKNKKKAPGNPDVLIPLLQRNYKWNRGSSAETQNTAVGLVGDIIEACNKNEDTYIIGLITVYKKEDTGIPLLIDGQQRLITLSLIAKALGFQNNSMWVRLSFERDESGKQREKFIYEVDCSDSGSVDVSRMKDNFNGIAKYIGDCKCNKDRLFQYILKNVMVMYRETQNEPLDEFLNINFRKIDFCAADYIKPYMLMDSERHDKIRRDVVLSLWGKLQERLYSLSDDHCVMQRYCADNDLTSSENDLFRLIKKNYKHYRNNRLEVMFEDKYYNKSKMKNVLKEYSSNNDPLRLEHERLRHCNAILSKLFCELCIPDADGSKRPNIIAYNAYGLLCAKRPDLTFFGMFSDEQDFNLTACSEREIKKDAHIDDLNQFTGALMDPVPYPYPSGKNTDIYKMTLMTGLDEGRKAYFAKNYLRFQNMFNEYTDMTEAARNGQERVDIILPASPGTAAIPNEPEYSRHEECHDTKLNEFGQMTMISLFNNDDIDEIVVPCIQRDYVMGNYAGKESEYRDTQYINGFLSRIRFCELKAAVGSAVNIKPELNPEWEVNVSDDFTDRVIRLFFSEDKYSYSIFDNSLDRSDSDNPDICIDLFRSLHPDTKYWDIVTDTLEMLGVSGAKWDNGKLKLGMKCGSNDLKTCNDGSLDARVTGYTADYINVSNSIFKNIRTAISAAFTTKIDYEKSPKMDFSCITGYLDEQKRFWVYDGQQRLTTVVVMLAASLVGNYDDKLAAMIRKFRFEGRDNANKMLETILDHASKNCDERDPEALSRTLKSLVVDQTCESIRVLFSRLTETTDKKIYPWFHFRKISRDFLLNGLEFTLVLSDKADDSEQLFIELNTGERLTDSEKYKAKFSYLLGKLWPDEPEKRYSIMRCVDNEWLNAWGSEEEVFKWIKYCVKCAYFEKKGYDGTRKADSLDGVDREVVELAVSGIKDICAGKSDWDDNNGIILWTNNMSLFLWANTLSFSEPKTISYCENNTGKIRFWRYEFLYLIQRLEKNNCLKEVYKIIAQHRAYNEVTVPENVLMNDNSILTDDQKRSAVKMETVRRLLLHRQNRYRAAIYYDQWKSYSETELLWQTQQVDTKNEKRVRGVSRSDIRNNLLNHDDRLKIIAALFYFGEAFLEKSLSGYALRKIIINEGFPEGIRFTFWTEIITDVSQIEDGLIYTEGFTVTRDDIAAQQERFLPALVEFLIKKGLIFSEEARHKVLPLEMNYDELNDFVNKNLSESAMMFELNVLAKSSLSDIHNWFYSSKDMVMKYLACFRKLVSECDNKARDHILGYAVKLAALMACNDMFSCENTDTQWFVYTVQNHLKETAGNNIGSLKELINFSVNDHRRSNSGNNEMGCDFRSLFPARIYLDKNIWQDTDEEFAAHERELYRQECGFAEKGGSDEDLIRRYDQHFYIGWF